MKESVLVRKFEIPSNLSCNIGQTNEICVYDDKIVVGTYEFLYNHIIAVRPSKERDGFIMELEDGNYNPINVEKIVTLHISKKGLFTKKKAKALGMEIYTIFYSALTNK